MGVPGKREVDLAVRASGTVARDGWMSGRAMARYETRTKTATANTTVVGQSPKPMPLRWGGLLM